MQRQQLLQLNYGLNPVPALRVHAVNVRGHILRPRQRGQHPLRGTVDRRAQGRDPFRFQHLNSRQPFRGHRHLHHQIVNDGAQLARVFHHPFGGGRHHLREQTAFTAQRVVQRGQQFVERRFTGRNDAWVGGHARQREDTRQLFDCRNVRCVEIKFHDVTLKISLHLPYHDKTCSRVDLHQDNFHSKVI